MTPKGNDSCQFYSLGRNEPLYPFGGSIWQIIPPPKKVCI